MKCKDKECKHKEWNGGDGISDFYFCKEVGVSVERGECECLLEEMEKQGWQNVIIVKN